MPVRGRAPAIALLLVVTAGCNLAGGPAVPRASTGPGAKKPVASPTAVAPGPGAGSASPVAPAAATRLVPQAGAPTQLTGKAKLISDHGAGVISNNGGALVSNNGGALVGNNGGALVGNNGGALTGKVKFGLAQAAAGESLLADARIEIRDAQGRVLVGPDGKPLTAMTDASGGYTLRAVLPAENLVLRIRLWNGGELAAILPRGGTPARELTIDTAATLGATYVLTQFVKGDQATFDKLPASEAERLQASLDAARGRIGKVPTYQPDELIALTEDLRKQDATVDRTLTGIKALLLGQANLGAGRQATEVGLSDVRVAQPAPDGALLVVEEVMGRIRRVAPDGTLTTLVDGLQGTLAKRNFFTMSDMRVGPDGTIYAVDQIANRVFRVAPDGAVAVVLGDGQPGPGADGGPGPAVAVSPGALALAADGTLFVGEGREGRRPRTLAVAPDGTARTLPAGPAAWDGGGFAGLDVAPDGTLYAAIYHKDDRPDGLYRLAPGAPAWTVVAADVALSDNAYVRVAPDGAIVLSDDQARRILRFDPTGARTVLAGAGGPPATADLNLPAGLAFKPDGTLVVTDTGEGVVRTLAPDGAWRTVAGTRAASQVVGDALAINSPGGLTLDAASDPPALVITESGNHTLKRLEGGKLVTIAGAGQGFGGDGGPALAARFDVPSGIALAGRELYVLDSNNDRLRRIGPDGRVATVVGGPKPIFPLVAGDPRPALAYPIGQGIALAIDPGGAPVWTSLDVHQVQRLRPDGEVELVAGTGQAGDGGDGEPATGARLNSPLGLVYGPDGALYITDCGNMRIRRIARPKDPVPTIETFAGVPALETFARLAGAADAEGVDRLACTLAVPSAMAFDAAGAMYVTELGTLNLPLLKGAGAFGELPLDDLPKVPARIRKIAPDGKVTTVAGPGGRYFADPLAADALVLPTGIAVDGSGRLVVLDGGANKVIFLPAGSF